MENRSFYNEILTEHNIHPEFKHDLPDANIELEGVNPSCGDDITLSLKLDGDTIDEAAFTGSGCAVSQASADILSDIITEESVDEARRLCNLFLAMIRGEVTDDEELADLGEAAQLKSISRMPARVKCAELAWRTAMTMLDEREKAEAGDVAQN